MSWSLARPAPARNWLHARCMPLLAAAASWCLSIVLPSPANFLNQNCSAMKKVHSLVQKSRARAVSNWRVEAPYSLTRLATCHCRCSPSCCACWKADLFSPLVEMRNARLISGWSAPLTRIFRNQSMRVRSVLICFFGSTCFHYRCQPLLNDMWMYR